VTRARVRIGGASGFWGDSQVALPQLLRDGGLDFIVFDYLAELTMSLLAAARAKQPEMGFAGDFVEQLRAHLSEVLRQRVKLVSNAGGVNPAGCAAAVAALAKELGLAPRIAVVDGDDVLALTDALRAEDVRDLQTGRPLPARLATANAYLGAVPIREALDAGADIVITGRCVDSAVTLGALMHAFEWSATDLDRLAMGSLAGHIIECGCQATGGLHTDWRDVPDWAGIGYPIVEVEADGRFVVTKPSGTGGLVSVPVVAEQMLYEIGDPARYVLPDVVCDFRAVTMKPAGPDRVAVEGARGRAPTDTYKVSATYPDGYRATAQLTIVGFEAAAKAERTAQAILERTRRLFREAGLADYTDTCVEVLGAASGHGPNAGGGASLREAVMRLAVAHADRRALDIFTREIAPAGTSWAPGTTGAGGRPQVARVLKPCAFLVPKTRVAARLVIDGEARVVEQPRDGAPEPVQRATGGARPAGDALRGGDSGARDGLPSDAGAPADATIASIEPAPEESDMPTVPLIAVAYARSGDKGDISNVGVIARSPELLGHLARELSAERVRAYLAHLVRGPATRYELPGIGAFNFVLEQALGGGGMASLRNDPLGKGMAQIVLSMPVRIPRRLVPAATAEGAGS
jgi:hypothetical protein